MMLTPHIMAGAALATVMPDSAVGRIGAFGVGMVSHYVLDSLPHWERLFGPSYNNQLPRDHSLWPKSIFIQGALDASVALLLLGYFVSVAPTPSALCIFLGGMGAALPDVIDSSPWWKHLTEKVPSWKAMRNIHDGVHISFEKQRRLPHFVGLATQLVTVGLALFILLRFKA